MLKVFNRGPSALIDTAPSLYPVSPESNLQLRFVGKNIRDVEAPAAILDAALVRKHCRNMLETSDALSVGFRAHVKTHKTVEIARLQVGDAPRPAKFIVSTVAEAEHLLPFMTECKNQGRQVNVLYGIPPSSTCFSRLKALREALGPDAVSFLIDHPMQLQNLFEDPNLKSDPVPILVKLDVGDHRAGLMTRSKALDSLLEVILHTQKVSSQPNIKLAGFYSHRGHSYGASSPEEAMEFLESEINSVLEAAKIAKEMGADQDRLLLSVGATPTATSAQNLLAEDSASGAAAMRLKRALEDIQNSFDLELHAGCYPLLDLQQLVTHARPAESPRSPTLASEDIAVRILVEVLSVYGERDKHEALVSAGTLALGREPCKAYPGWAVVAPSPWHHEKEQTIYNEEDKTGWMVARISQEHGILNWEGSTERFQDLRIGQKLLLWPNHACIASANFGWYLIVDSEHENGPTQVTDVWVRWRGW